MTYLLLALMIYLLGVPVAWFKEYFAMFDYIENVQSDYSEWHGCCVKWANQECKLSWISLLINT